MASDCLPQHLVDAEQCVPTGDCFCGQRQAQAQTRVIPIRAVPGGARPGHCERAGFESMVSVPVRLQERLVGEINLFYRQHRHAVRRRPRAAGNAGQPPGRCHGSLRAGALEREAAVAEERGLLARELHDSIAQSLAFLKIQAGLLRDELEQQQRPSAATARWPSWTPASARAWPTCASCCCTFAPAPTARTSPRRCAPR
jgi:two-component system nitrate/nitrite sensor histidine kinase NarX